MIKITIIIMLVTADKKWKDSVQILRKGQPGEHDFSVMGFEIRIGFDARSIEKTVEETGIFEGEIPAEIGEYARSDIEIHRTINGALDLFDRGGFAIYNHLGKLIDKDEAWVLKKIMNLPAIILSLDVYDSIKVTPLRFHRIW